MKRHYLLERRASHKTTSGIKMKERHIKGNVPVPSVVKYQQSSSQKYFQLQRTLRSELNVSVGLLSMSLPLGDDAVSELFFNKRKDCLCCFDLDMVWF
mmetsp:Transcript_27387/g.41458  ORF Transcript_27387/g.41458 Transcript_27387/m.41458 type:complete len:98 (+) Transcript_27387:1268-1561(+)